MIITDPKQLAAAYLTTGPVNVETLAAVFEAIRQQTHEAALQAVISKADHLEMELEYVHEDCIIEMAKHPITKEMKMWSSDWIRWVTLPEFKFDSARK